MNLRSDVSLPYFSIPLRSTSIFRKLVLIIVGVILFSLLFRSLSRRSLDDEYCEGPHQVITYDELNQKWEAPSLEIKGSVITLEERIGKFGSRPMANQSMWNAFNEEYCSDTRVGGQNNPYQVDASLETWEAMTIERVQEIRGGLIHVLQKAMKDGVIDETGQAIVRGKGKGIVFCAGNADTFSRVITSLRLLRSYNTTLPAEVFHFSSESPSEGEITDLLDLGATLRTVEISKDVGEHPGVEGEEMRLKNFHIKGEAFSSSSFEEILYLDSDSIPAKDVTPLFFTPGYLRFGALFWPDFWKDNKLNAIWSILGIQCRDGFQIEAGQVLIDRARHLDALLLVEYMAKSFEVFFKFSDGDKDLFRYAFLALSKRWAVIPRSLSSASFRPGGDEEVDSKETCGHTMLQFDPYGKPMFVHANTLKRYKGNFVVGNSWGKAETIDFDLFSQYFNFSISTNQSGSVPFSDGNTAADELANINYATGYGIESSRIPSSTSPYSISQQRAMMQAKRIRAVMQAGTFASFRNDFRMGQYVLCVVARWEGRFGRDDRSDQLNAVELNASCLEDKLSIDWTGIDQGKVLKLEDFADDPILKDFEEAFYKIGRGRANGEGF